MLKALRVQVRVAVVVVLGGSACVSPTSAIGTDEPVGTEASRTILQLEQERAAAAGFTPFFTGPLASNDSTARAALGLGRLERVDAAPALLQALAHKDPAVAAAAAFGLGQLDLALVAGTSAHDAVRADAEAALQAALKNADVSVQRAAVRALGRLAVRDGLDALVGLAGKDGPLQAEALTAVGVSGARRRASKQEDPALVAAVSVALGSSAADVVRGAAYAVFRQKIRVPLPALRAAMAGADPEARILVMRGLAGQDDSTAAALIPTGLQDADWRVQVEALRAAGMRGGTLDTVAAALDGAVVRLRSNAADAGAAAHVLREGCYALAAGAASPAQAGPVIKRVLNALAGRTVDRPVLCACAVADQVIAEDPDALAQCTDGLSPTDVARVEIDVAARARVSSKERVLALDPYVHADDVAVRMAAATALAADASAEAAQTAAHQLEKETDAAVCATLLSLFDAGEHAAFLNDGVLYKITERFTKMRSPEGVDALLAVAGLVKGRNAPTPRAIRAQLTSYGDARLADVANGVAAADQAPGPRAKVNAVPALSDLPLYALLKTTRGEIRIGFERGIAAATVANFAELARRGFYKGTRFHRVIADFVAQGGDPRGDGSGGPGYSIACENSDAGFTRGAVGMATAGKDTGGSQFFLTHAWQPHLDGRYTLFARVVDGLDVMDALQPDDVLLDVDFTNAVPKR